jgi:hypothetical protein
VWTSRDGKTNRVKMKASWDFATQKGRHANSTGWLQTTKNAYPCSLC